jgi:hypothetical protein
VAVASFLADSRRTALEEKHRRGYQGHGQNAREIAEWEGIQEWPEK